MHRLSCGGCGATACGTLPEGVAAGHFSPYTQAVLATLAGAYRLSKRQIQRLTADLFGLTLSTGMISKLEKQSAAALAGPYDGLARSVLEAEAVNIDETGWREDRLFEAWHQPGDGGAERGPSRSGSPFFTGLGCAVTWRTGRSVATRRRARTSAEIFRVEEGLWSFVWFPGGWS